MLKIKKKFIAISILMIFLIQLVSAASFDFDNAQSQITRIIDAGLGILSPLFEKILGDYDSSEFFFQKILLLFLLIIITKFVLEKTPIGSKNKKVSLLISILVSVIAIRFINQNNFFEAIFLQYGVMGIAISTLLPLVIFFYFVHTINVGTFGRKFFWIMYVIILIFLWLSKSGDIPAAANWIYGLAILTAGGLLFFDKDVHKYFGTSHLRIFMAKSNKEGIYRAKERLHKAFERYNSTPSLMSKYEYDQIVKEEEKRIKELSE